MNSSIDEPRRYPGYASQIIITDLKERVKEMVESMQDESGQVSF